jgi:hypothetical protein
MIGTDGGCAHETDPTALQKLTVYLRDGTDQQYVSITDIRVRHGTTGDPMNLSDIAEEAIQ